MGARADEELGIGGEAAGFSGLLERRRADRDRLAGGDDAVAEAGDRLACGKGGAVLAEPHRLAGGIERQGVRLDALVGRSRRALAWRRLAAAVAGGQEERRDRRGEADPSQSARSTSIFFVSAIALAGLRPFGQTLAQFMIVWHR